MTTSISGVWSAVLVNGRTVYQSNGQAKDGPVNLVGQAPELHVFSGAVVTGLTSPMSAWGAKWASAFIQSGGTIENSTLQSIVAVVSSGGVLANNTLNHTGDKIYSGGTAVNNTKFNGGDLYADRTARVNNMTLDKSLSVLSGAIWSGGTVQSGGVFSAVSGSLVQDAVVLRGGQVVVLSGATAQNVKTLGTGLNGPGTGIQGSLILRSGGTSFDARIEGGYMSVQGNGAVSHDAYVTSNGWQDVGSNNNGAMGGGVASSTTLINGGAQFVRSGLAVDTQVSSGGRQEVKAGGTAIGGTVFSAGQFQIDAGGTGINNAVLSGGQGNVWGVAQASNGVASGLIVQNGGSAVVLSGGVVSAFTILSGGRGFVSSAGVMADTVISRGAQARVLSGGTASGLTVLGNGWWSTTEGAILIGSGGTSLNATIAGGYQSVQGQGAYSENALVTSNGWQDVGWNSRDNTYGGGVASGSTLVSGGKQFISGGTATNTTISSAGTQNVLATGVTSGSLIASGGSMIVQAGGTAFNGLVASGGTGLINQGGTAIAADGLTSGLTIQAGGTGLVLAGGTASALVASGNSAWVATYGSGSTAAITNGLSLRSGARQDVGALWQNGTIISRGSAVANDTQIGNNTYQWVGSGGTGVRSIVSGGGTLLLDSGALGLSARVLSSGIAQVQGGAILSGAVVSGTNAYLATYGNAGGTAVTSGATLQDGGRQDVGALWQNLGPIVSRGPARADDTYIGNRSNQWVGTGGVASRSLVASGGTLILDAGGNGWNPTILSGGTGSVRNGGMVSGSLVSSGGTLTIQGGGTGTNDQILPGGTGIVQAGATEIVSGGIASGMTVQAGASAFVQAGGTAIDFVASGAVRVATYGSNGVPAVTSSLRLKAGAWQDVGIDWGVGRGPAIAYDTQIESGSYQWVDSGGTAARTVVSAGGGLQIGSSGLARNATVLAGASAVVAGGGIFADGQIKSGASLSGSAGALWAGNNTIAGVVSGGSVIDQGVLEILSGGTARDLSVVSGGSLQIDAGGKLSGLASLAPGASATLDGNAGGTINLGGDGYTRLTLTGTTSPTSIISGFNGESPSASDQIILRDIPKSQILGVDFPDDDHVEFLLSGNRRLRLAVPGAGKKPARYDLSEGPGNSTIFAVCFLAGTLIRTPEGERAVETLVPGDLVYVYHNGRQETQCIKWVGHRSVESDESAGFELTQYPVRISAGALGDNVPYKDLLVTPEHCLFIDGALVPARMLVNGRSITHDTSLARYTYHHFETQTHSVVMADGMLSETYLDTGNRVNLMAGAGEISCDRATGGSPEGRAMAAPLGVSQEFVEPLWNRIAHRAGVERNDNRKFDDVIPSIHLSTEAGDILSPVRVKDGYYIFHIPETCSLVHICSPAARPSEAIGPFVDDRRKLGVLVGRMTLYAPEGVTEIDVRHFLYHARGWHAAEDHALRWTQGCAVLPLGYSSGAGQRVLAIQVLATGPCAPVEDRATVLHRDIEGGDNGTRLSFR